MAADSGQFGTIKINETEPDYEVRNWDFTGNANNQSYASNKSEGYTRSVEGVKSGTGSFVIFFDESNNAIGLAEGDIFYFEGYYDDTHYISMYARVDTIAENCDIEGGTPTGATVSFSNYGAWTRGSATTEPTPSGI